MGCRLNSNKSPLSAIASTVVLLAILGCSKQDRTAVSGTVTFDGQPLPAGQIVFEPTSAGRLGIAQIANGSYSMPAAQGPTPGKYVVRITATRPSGHKIATRGGRDKEAFVEPIEQFIPSKYNEQSQLTTDVEGQGAIERNFTLTSK
jgi:hypothetical protein